MVNHRLLLCILIAIFSSTGWSFTQPNTQLNPRHLLDAHHLTRNHAVWSKHDIASLHSTEIKDKIKTYFKDFGFHPFNNQYNRRLSSSGVGVSYPISSSLFTMVQIGVSKHILNKNDYALEPTFGFGIYFKTPNRYTPKTNHQLYAYRLNH